MKSGPSADPHAHPPVLLLTGVGLTAAVAVRWVAALETHFRVLSALPGAAAIEATADERHGPHAGRHGIGDERHGPAEGRPITRAEDAVALLDGAGVERAHIVGLSFGGVIAQELAIRHQGRVCSLALGSSSAGGALYVPAQRPVRHFLRRLQDLPSEEGLWAAVPYLYAEATYRRHAPLIGEDIARRLGRPLDPRSYRAQHAIARAHDASSRLAAITAPTLVMHGEHDRILPLNNGRLLADGIPGARFIALPGGAHAFPTDVPDASAELVSFLRAHSPRQRGSRASSGRAEPPSQEAPAPKATRNARAGRA